MTVANDSDGLKRIGERVVARRCKLGMATRQALADRTGLSYRLLGDIESGRRAVTTGSYAVVEQALRWEPGSLLRVSHGGEPFAIEPWNRADLPLFDHRYLSDACDHGLHVHCEGKKCEWCLGPCQCGCHAPPVTVTP